MHVIEAVKSKTRVPDLHIPSGEIADGAFRDQALVVEAKAVLQSMKKTATHLLTSKKHLFDAKKHANWFQCW